MRTLSAQAATLVLGLIWLLPALGVGNTDLGNGFVNAAGAGYLAPTVTTPSSCNASTPPAQDATFIIQQAIDDVAASGGGTVYLPTGMYCVKTRLIVKSQVTLKGVFESVPTRGAVTPPTYGTVLLAIGNPNLPTASPFIYLMFESMVDGLTVYYPNQLLPTGSTFTPIAYPYTISAEKDTTIKNIMLWNSYQGIKIFSADAARHQIHNVFGQPLLTGIKIDGALDVGRISNVHFWPFWSGGNNAAVRNFQKQYATAFHFGRVDDEQISNIFVFGYGVAMWFDESTTVTGSATAQLNNLVFDYVGVGIHMTATSVLGLAFDNLFINVVDDPSAFRYGIWNESSGRSATVQISNGTFAGQMRQAIRWEQGVRLQVANSNFAVGSFTPGVPSVQIDKGDAMISGNSFWGGASACGTPAVQVASTAGRVMVVGNSLYCSTIVNSSSTFLQANNLP